MRLEDFLPRKTRVWGTGPIATRVGKVLPKKKKTALLLTAQPIERAMMELCLVLVAVKRNFLDRRRGPNDQKNSIPIENVNLDRNV